MRYPDTEACAVTNENSPRETTKWIVHVSLAVDPIGPKDSAPRLASVDSEFSLVVKSDTASAACAVALRICESMRGGNLIAMARPLGR